MKHTSVLAPTGISPFKRGKIPPTPTSKLRVSEGAVIIEFKNQPTMMIAQRIAPAYRYMLWATSTVQFHTDDWTERVECIVTCSSVTV